MNVITLLSFFSYFYLVLALLFIFIMYIFFEFGSLGTQNKGLDPAASIIQFTYHYIYVIVYWMLLSQVCLPNYLVLQCWQSTFSSKHTVLKTSQRQNFTSRDLAHTSWQGYYLYTHTHTHTYILCHLEVP